MTIYGGSELTVPDYDGGSLLLLPTLRHEEWGMLDLESLKLLIATLRVAGSIKANRRVPFLAQASAAICDHIQKLQMESAEAVAGQLVGVKGSPGRAEAVSHVLNVFPRHLRGVEETTALTAEKTVWDIYGYGREIFEEMRLSAKGIVGSLDEMADLDYNVRVAQKLFHEFEKLKFRDWSDSATPQVSKDSNRVVDVGCDLKHVLTLLSCVGPVLCELGADDAFENLKGKDGTPPPPPQNVRAMVPPTPEKPDDEAYVAVVAWRPSEALEKQLVQEKKKLRDVVIDIERKGLFDVQYLLRRVDADGKTVADWGDHGYAWMAHADFRRAFRWGRAKIPHSFLSNSTAVSHSAPAAAPASAS